MQIITRYLLREMLQTLVAVTLILLFIFTCNIFIRYLNYVASGKYAGWVIFQIVGLQIPVLLGLLLPLGGYLGILLGLGRLYADSEMTVLFACGFGKQNIIKILSIFAAIVMLLTALLSIFIEPNIVLRSRELLASANAASLLQTIFPGRFESMQGGQQVFYVQKVNRMHSVAQNIFVAQQAKPEKVTATEKSQPTGIRWTTLYAKEATQKFFPELGAEYMLLTNGYVYKGIPGQADYQMARYQTYAIRISEVNIAGLDQLIDSMPVSQLIGRYHEKAVAAELQWRFSAPLSVIILTLIAFPLAQIRPRQGRYAKLLPAALIYIIYANLMFIGRGWVQSGAIPIWLGVWWIHAIFLIFAGFLWYRQR